MFWSKQNLRKEKSKVNWNFLSKDTLMSLKLKSLSIVAKNSNATLKAKPWKRILQQLLNKKQQLRFTTLQYLALVETQQSQQNSDFIKIKEVKLILCVIHQTSGCQVNLVEKVLYRHLMLIKCFERRTILKKREESKD